MTRHFFNIVGLSFLVLTANCQGQPQIAGRLELPAIEDGETIIEYSGFTVSYDRDNKQARWVAYELADWECNGPASREGKSFKRDPRAHVPQADDSDYRRSGWTRGHLAPAADFRWSEQALTETFQFTNCSPQDEYMNNYSWEELESRARYWAKKFGSVYIVTGPIVGEHEHGFIGSNRIPIPDAFFKAFVTVDDSGLTPVYRSVAFVMHNTDAKQPYPDCSMTVNQLEEVLGIDLFTALPDNVEEEVESTVDRSFWRF